MWKMMQYVKSTNSNDAHCFAALNRGTGCDNICKLTYVKIESYVLNLSSTKGASIFYVDSQGGGGLAKCLLY